MIQNRFVGAVRRSSRKRREYWLSGIAEDNGKTIMTFMIVACVTRT
jgi:hypothetical protein